MLVKNRADQMLIKVKDLNDLFNPFHETIQGCEQGGQEEQPPQTFEKSQLMFPSGEALPQCWVDPDYRNAE